MGSVTAGLHERTYEPGHVHGLLSPRGPLEPGGSGNPLPDTPLGPDLVVRLRHRTGFTEEGAPVFEWTDVLSGVAILWESREEWDDRAGVTRVRAKVRVLNDDHVESVPETAILVEPSSGLSWRIMSSSVTPTMVEFEAERMEHGESEAGVVPGPEPVMASMAVIPSEPFVLSWGGSLEVVDGTTRLPIKGGVFRVDTIAASLGTAASGGEVRCDVTVNDVSLFPDPSQEIVFPEGVSDAQVGEHLDTVLAEGDWVSVDIEQVGLVSPGADLVVVIRLERME